MAQPGFPKKNKPKPKKKKIDGNTRRIREAEDRMQQGQIGGNLPIDATATVAAEGEDAGFSSRVGDKDKAFGMKRGRKVKKKGYAMGGSMKKKGFANGGMMKKKGMKKGGKVRGAGIARKGVRPAKMR